MGARTYLPTYGIFTATDPIFGGNANPYTYPGDPINGADLGGTRGISNERIPTLSAIKGSAFWFFFSIEQVVFAFGPDETGVGEGIDAAEVAGSASGAMAGVRAAGYEGEQAAGIVKNTLRIASKIGNLSYRFPDELNSSVIGEVKNVSSLSFTSQLRDLLYHSQDNSLSFNLYVRESTTLSGPLQEAIFNGEINLIRRLQG